MPLNAYTIPTFGGLNLLNDIEDLPPNQAVDLLNVDLDKSGRLRSRDGYDNLTASAYTDRFKYLTPYYTTGGLKHIIGATATSGGHNSLVAYTTAGAVVAGSGAGTPVTYFKGVRFGTPDTEYLYIPTIDFAGGLAQTARWDGTVFTLPVGIPGGGKYLAVQSPDNRLVMANCSFSGALPQPSRVWFSNAGLAETWTASDFVHITPGDGEAITGLCSWRELIFAFKESKFAVFTGNSSSGTGTATFNYRLVDGGIGTPGPWTVGRPGVFFLNRRGIYVTTGNEPTLISSVLDPLFLNTLTGPYTGSAINMAQIANASMTWVNERLYVAVPTGSSTFNDRLLVWEPKIDQWSVWNIAAQGLTGFRVGDNEDLTFAYSTGSNHIGRHNVAFTTDDGVAIATSYQSAFYKPSPGSDVTTRWTKLWGTGSPTLNIFNEHATSDPFSRGGTVTLGTAPQVAKGYHLKAYTGELFSHKISSTSGAWSVNRIEHDITNTFQPA